MKSNNQIGGLALRFQHRATMNSSIENIAQWENEIEILKGISTSHEKKLVHVEI